MTTNCQLYNIQFNIDKKKNMMIDSQKTGCINSFLYTDPFCLKQAHVIPDWEILVLLSV